MTTTHDLVLAGGRVLDPESGLDAVRDVGVTGGVVSGVGERLAGRRRTDVSGLAVAPGFIDMHSHAQTVMSMRLQACDGVTTALELEAGALSVERAHREAERAGRPINYGFSASWAAARMAVLGGLKTDHARGDVPSRISDTAWTGAGTADVTRRVVDRLEKELAAGALGIGVLLGYAPGAEHREYLDVARLAARYRVPTFTHARHKNQAEPGTALQGVQEIVAVGLDSGAHMHLCHLNSTSLRQLDLVTELIGRAREHGVGITTEAYPYGTSMTALGAAFLDPGNLARLGLLPTDIVYTPTGERPADADRLRTLREQDPGAMALIRYLDESRAADRELLARATLFDDTAVASDALPLYGPDGRVLTGTQWPPPEGATTHPRSAGTFARTLRVFARERAELSLLEAVRRCTLLPARILASVSPQFARKGRVRTGADADLTVFDPGTVTDNSTYDAPGRASTGIRHVLVNGTFVVRDQAVETAAMPGRPVRAGTL
ncbi:amidohydrolase family protein [Streptomyces sp. SL13]|uniref:Amidohydrolase family protein n=1 Tax=Streptantibioticus silvisoli TaxID=2705255 RepID=A0AA90H5I5_9ACTN|nr:amidohydrolase family protein [Streptantibioticus silvisoli]MDI5971029.1 amidohydrolase family protein [Streptantibioticus silvisoli]